MVNYAVLERAKQLTVLLKARFLQLRQVKQYCLFVSVLQTLPQHLCVVLRKKLFELLFSQLYPDNLCFILNASIRQYVMCLFSSA